jgi:hypothetical protein
LPNGIYQTKNPNLGEFCRVLEWQMLVHFMAIWSISRPFGMAYGHLVYNLWSLGKFFPHFGMVHQEKSGNPGSARLSKILTNLQVQESDKTHFSKSETCYRFLQKAVA